MQHGVASLIPLRGPRDVTRSNSIWCYAVNGICRYMSLAMNGTCNVMDPSDVL